MAHNIMKEYVIHTEKFLQEFMQIFFQDNYNKNIANKFIESYVEARYCNYGGNIEQKVFYRRIYSALQREADKIKKTVKKEDKEIVQKILDIYQYVFYIDFVRPIKIELKEFVDQMYEKRITKFEMPKNSIIKEKMLKAIKIYRDEKDKYLEEFESEDFTLITQKYHLIKDAYKVNLKYNFKIPYIYSENATIDVYNENIVNEDKLMIEYIMLTVESIKEIRDGKFNKNYIVDFPASLFSKTKKMKQLKNIIDYPIIQEKVILKIKYEDFVKFRQEFYEMMKNGYKFAVVLGKNFKETADSVKKLTMFSYVITNKKSDELERQIENLIIDEG